LRLGGAPGPDPGKIGLTILGEHLRIFEEFSGEANFTMKMAAGEALDVY
jgi:hypothetical protein